MSTTSERVSCLGVSATLAVQRKANELKARGVNLVNFGIGEPDLDTPEHVKREAERAIAENFTKYTDAGGIPELREAVAQKYARDYGATYDPASEVVITCGAKQALFNAALALFEPGDQVILPTPYWVSYPQQIRLAGAEVVLLPTREERRFAVTAREVEQLVTPQTKAIFLNSPNNPAGAVIAPAELARVVELVRERGLYLIYDECYEPFVYEGEPLSAARHGVENVIVVGSCSKTYAMTGWRIGWAAGPPQVIEAMERIQSQSTSNPTSVAQRAALAALTGDQSGVRAMVEAYRERRDAMVRGLSKIPGIRCAPPPGAFYVFPNVSGLFDGTLRNSTELAMHLLERAGVVAISGAEFGRDGYLRLSYATSMERIEEGLERLRRLFA